MLHSGAEPIGEQLLAFGQLAASVLRRELPEVQGQAQLFRQEQREEKVDGWYVIPGKIDRVSYLLPLFFVLSIGAMWFFEALI